MATEAAQPEKTQSELVVKMPAQAAAIWKRSAQSLK